MEGKIYFIKAKESNLIKIGRTNGLVTKRKKAIQNMSPVHLYTLQTLWSKDCIAFERQMHELFSPIRKHGEWFDFNGELVGALKKSLKKPKGRKDGDLFDIESFLSFWKKEMACFSYDWI